MMKNYNRFLLDLTAAPNDEIELLVAQLQQQMSKHQVRSLSLAVVEYRPAPEIGQDIWVRLPRSLGGAYHAVSMGGLEKFSGLQLTADMLRDLQQRGVCLELRAEGREHDSLLPRRTGALEASHALVGAHGFKINSQNQGLKVTVQDVCYDGDLAAADAPDISIPYAVWVCIRLPV